MTRVSGYSLIASPCCKSLYKTPYGFMNLSATGYWTDGAKENSLWSTSGGLRMCRCGTAFLLMDAVQLDIEAGPEIADAEDVNPADLPKIIGNASSPRLEVMARRNYWRHLNDGYKEQYRAHRAAEDAVTNTWWRRANRASLVALQLASRKLIGAKPEPDVKTKRPFTVPPYNPTAEQLENMKRLLSLILDGAEEPFNIDWLEVAELYREQVRFAQAKDALSRCTEDYKATKKKVIAEQLHQQSSTPIRYRDSFFS